MKLDEAQKFVLETLDYEATRFYNSVVESLPLGFGLVFDRVRYPVYQPEKRLFATDRGPVYVITHECDIARENPKPFNESVLICPIIRLENFVELYLAEYSSDQLRRFLGNMATRKTYRLFYFPPYNHRLPYGGVLNLNELAHTNIDELDHEDSERICSLSAYGIGVFDKLFQNHLFRESEKRLTYYR